MQIIVVPYDSHWPEAFNYEAKQIKMILKEVPFNIHHIGSTSVPGLMAKPIIDMLLDVADLNSLDAYDYEFEKLGYEAMGENGISGRRYFRKGGDQRTHQLHAFQSGNPHLARHLAFRDYLIAHKEVAEEYGKLKFSIAQSCDNDIEKYCDRKDPFIKYHEAKALKWYQER